MIIDRKVQGRETVTSTFILNSEGQFIEDDKSEGESLISFFGIEAQESPLQNGEEKVAKVSHGSNNETPFEQLSNTIFQRHNLLTKRCIHLFDQAFVVEKLNLNTVATPEKSSLITPESNDFSRHNYMKQDRFIQTTC